MASLIQSKESVSTPLGFEEENPKAWGVSGHSPDDRRQIASAVAGVINQLLCIRLSVSPFGVVIATVISTKAIASPPGCTPLCG